MTLSKTLRLILILALAMGWTLGDAAQAAKPDQTSPEAAAFIKTLGKQILAIQESESPIAAKALQDLIRHGFDLNRISQLVLGKFWSQATEQQRVEFKDLFAEYFLKAFSRHLDAYRVDTLEVIAVNSIGGDFLVQTSMERDGDMANAVWQVRVRDGEHKIIDVFIDGISLTRIYHSEFASVIGQKGLDGMLGYLRERVSGQTRSPEKSAPVGLRASILLSPNVDEINLLLRKR